MGGNSSYPSSPKKSIQREIGEFKINPFIPPERELSQEDCKSIIKRAKRRLSETWFPEGNRTGVIPHGGVAKVTVPQTTPGKLRISTEVREVPDFIRHKVTEEQIQGLKQKDARVLEYSSVYPYCAVGVVSYSHCNDKNSYGMGTGSIVGPQLILTCAHVVINEKTNEVREDISFTPAPLFPMKVGAYKAKRIYYNTKFSDHDLVRQRNIENFYRYDYAIIELDTTQNLQEIYGSLGFDFDWDLNTSDKDMTLIGYPIISDKPVFKELSGNTIMDDGIMRHNMDTRYGSSGSPILERKGQNWIIRAIHNSQDNVCKSAVPLSEKMLEDIQGMMSVPYISFSFAGYYNADTIIGFTGLGYFCKYLTKNPQDNIRELDLNNNNIGDTGCYQLTRLPCLDNLTSIHLELNNIGPDGCQKLTRANWPHLQRLVLWSNHVGDEGCMHLAKCKFPKLQFIDLNGDNIGAAGCAYLRYSQWYNLHTFYFWNNHIEDKGCEYLSQCIWPQLKLLCLQLNGITTGGCYKLAQAKWQLNQLRIWSNNIGQDGYEVLRSKGWQVEWKKN